ncbi:MAG: hypothetical protein LBN38_05500 [Verrucomicrobiota bacterium]|jgi:hypothetical protein|nr:hypothetical protein [Verrucomicrobiota bacterium]
MASVNEQIVRAYLESVGFLVRQPRKYQVMSRSKGLHEEVDFLAFNPLADEKGKRPSDLLWGGRELSRIRFAVVTVRGWHSEKFTAAMLASSPDVYRFAEPESIRSAEAELGMPEPAKILCMADLPVSSDQREEALEFLKSRGIDGVLLFRTMLLELADRVDVKKSYEKSDLLQVLRILKNYDLLQSGQMNLFAPFRRRRASSPSPSDTSLELPLPSREDDPLP